MADNRTDTRTPDQIERDIRATQEDMSRTVNDLGNGLSARNLLNSLLDKADENGIEARTLIDSARRNPLALGMIAIGSLWLVSEADARPSALKPSGMKFGGRSGKDNPDSWQQEGWHPEHRAYVEHMSLCERRADEDDDTYRRRREAARANFLMVEQRHDEDEHGFRQRLDEATERLRERRERALEGARQRAGSTRDSARQAAAGTRDGARRAAEKAEGFYHENPLIGGLAAAFVGAIAGSALPATRTEREYLGSVGEQALGMASRKAHEAGDAARHKKDEMVDKAEHRMGDGQGKDGGKDRGQSRESRQPIPPGASYQPV